MILTEYSIVRCNDFGVFIRQVWNRDSESVNHIMGLSTNTSERPLERSRSAMTKEQMFFLQVLADYLRGKSTDVPETNLDWRQLCKYANSHSVGGIVYQQCKTAFTAEMGLSEIGKALANEQQVACYSFIRNQNAYDELRRIIWDDNIRFSIVKGLEVACVYPIPALRTMGDLDIVMNRADRDRIHEPMLQNGYVLHDGGNEKHYVKGPVTVELHYALAYGGEDVNTRRVDYFNAFWDHIVSEEKGRCYLDCNFHFLFLVWHLMKHLSNGGVGFRQFMDVAVTAAKWPLDWNQIERDAREIGMWEFLQNVLAFCKRWWNVDLPIAVENVDDEFFEEATQAVFSNGVFGFEKGEMRWAETAGKYMDLTNVPAPFRPAAAAWRKVFISYDAMLTKTYCGFVKGRKYLLPLAWFYRIWYVAVHKRGRIRTWEKAIFRSQDVIDQRRRMMERWGI